MPQRITDDESAGAAMSDELDLLDVTHSLLEAIHNGDVEAYRAMSVEDLTGYETDVAPYRVDGLDFHVDLMRAMARHGTYQTLVRFDMLTPRVQVYGDCGIVTYTRLMTYMTGSAPHWSAFNETRVFVRQEGKWRMAHFHRSAAGAAPAP